MISFEVLAVVYNPTSNQIEVVKRIVNDNNSDELNLQTFSTDAIEWRAAEFESTDMAEIFELIVSEPHVSQSGNGRSKKEKANAVRANLTVRGSTQSEKARARQIMNSFGVHQRYVDASDTVPMEVVQANCPFDPEAVQIKTEYLKKSKKEVIIPKVDRVEDLRSRLLGENPSRTEVNIKPENIVNPPVILEKNKRVENNE